MRLNFNRKFIFFISLVVLLVALVAPFLDSESIFAWTAGLCYVAYDTFLIVFVAFQILKFLNSRDSQVKISDSELTVAVVIPARNEKLILGACLESIRAQLDCINEVLLLDDGSDDGTLDWIKKNLMLTSLESELWQSQSEIKIRVLSKEHSGKADSLNRALPYLNSDLIVTVDADTILESDAILKMREAFESDPELIAAGGVLVPFCQPTLWGKIFQIFQSFEYIRAFLSRQAWMNQNSLLLVSGAFACYRLQDLKDVGGYDLKTWVEDYELIHRLYFYFLRQNRNIRIGVVPESRGKTDCPDSLVKFLKQRRRWFGGFLQTIYKYRMMIGNPQFRKVGSQMLPVKLIDTLQPLYGLASLYALFAIFYFNRSLNHLVLFVLVAKLSIDLFYHFYCISLYGRWQKRALPFYYWLFVTIMTICEPIFFQPIRHLGAALGWLGFLSSRQSQPDAWTPKQHESYRLQDGGPVR